MGAGRRHSPEARSGSPGELVCCVWVFEASRVPRGVRPPEAPVRPLCCSRARGGLGAGVPRGPPLDYATDGLVLGQGVSEEALVRDQASSTSS
eukprot:2945637-Alexandrium_andersonii.AAC.1